MEFISSEDLNIYPKFTLRDMNLHKLFKTLQTI